MPDAVLGTSRLARREQRAASFREAWELHRAAEMVRQVSIGLDRAHQIEAEQVYVRPAAQLGAGPVPGVSL